jgi:hypothetical protein
MLNGYMSFSIYDSSKNGGSYPILVHLLAALQKFGEEALSPGVQVRHKNGNPTDNSQGNILIGSPRQNQLDRDHSDRIRCARLGARAKRKLSDVQVHQLRSEYTESSVSRRDLANKYGISKTSVAYIVTGKTYREV